MLPDVLLNFSESSDLIRTSHIDFPSRFNMATCKDLKRKRSLSSELPVTKSARLENEEDGPSACERVFGVQELADEIFMCLWRQTRLHERSCDFPDSVIWKKSGRPFRQDPWIEAAGRYDETDEESSASKDDPEPEGEVEDDEDGSEHEEGPEHDDSEAGSEGDLENDVGSEVWTDSGSEEQCNTVEWRRVSEHYEGLRVPQDSRVAWAYTKNWGPGAVYADIVRCQRVSRTWRRAIVQCAELQNVMGLRSNATAGSFGEVNSKWVNRWGQPGKAHSNELLGSLLDYNCIYESIDYSPRQARFMVQINDIRQYDEVFRGSWIANLLLTEPPTRALALITASHFPETSNDRLLEYDENGRGVSHNHFLAMHYHDTGFRLHHVIEMIREQFQKYSTVASIGVFTADHARSSASIELAYNGQRSFSVEQRNAPLQKLKKLWPWSSNVCKWPCCTCLDYPCPESGIIKGDRPPRLPSC